MIFHIVLYNILYLLFYRHGRLTSRYPFRYIFSCLLITIALGSGLYFLQWETNIVRLWNPENSESGTNFKWLWKNHPPDLRRHSILFQADNMLDKDNLIKVFVFLLKSQGPRNFKIYPRKSRKWA